MEKLAELPTPALVTLGFVLAIIMGVRFLGLWQGERTMPSKSQNTAQVAAVIVDPTALNNATAAVIKHTVVMEAVIDAGEELSKSIDHMTASDTRAAQWFMKITRALR